MPLQSKKVVQVVDLITFAVPFFAFITFIIKMITRWSPKDDALIYCMLSIAISSTLVRIVFAVIKPVLIRYNDE